MKVNILAFGIARDILGKSEADVELQDGNTIEELKQLLLQKHPKFADLASLSFAVNEEYRKDDFHLSEGDEVVIIPPVSGG